MNGRVFFSASLLVALSLIFIPVLAHAQSKKPHKPAVVEQVDDDDAEEVSDEEMINDSKARQRSRAHENEEMSDKHWRFGGMIYYSLAKQLAFNAVNSNSAGYTYKYNMDAAPGVGVEVAYSGHQTWGMQAGFQMDAARTISDFALTGTSGTQTGNYSGSTQPKITFIDVYLNVCYQWQNFYLVGGMNIAGVGQTDPPVPIKDISGTQGGQGGLGWEFNSHLSVEALVRVLSVLGKKQIDATSGSTEVGYGYLVGSVLSLKGYF